MIRRQSVLIVAVALAALACDSVKPTASTAPRDPTPTPAGPVVTGSPSPASADSCAPEAGPWAQSVQVTLSDVSRAGPTIAFGLPVPAGVVSDVAGVRVTSSGEPVDAAVSVLLQRYGEAGEPTGVQSVLVELPSSGIVDGAVIEIAWSGGSAATERRTTFAEVSMEADEAVEVAERTIADQGGTAALVETARTSAVLFRAREPLVLATYPDGYLAATGILGCQTAASQVSDELAGIRFIADRATPFGLSAAYYESYPVNPASVYVLDPEAPNDPSIIYEGWLYDRCTTFLSLYAHTAELRFLTTGFRQCSYYASRIGLDGERRGIFADKPEPDTKYSHARGLFVYYALTGDEAALEAGKAIAELWLGDQEFVGPYRAGHLAGPDKLWTERLLAHSLDGLFYGHRLTGETKYLGASRELVTTAYRHVTGDAAALAAINPETPPFPPQNCFVHTAGQAAEGNADQPFCSGWMPALLVGTLLAYQEQTADPQVDEIFIRLTRFLRDVGSGYRTGDIHGDSFFEPAVRYDSNDGESRRILLPLYGAGVDVDGTRRFYGEYDDADHCLDAMAIAAAGTRALKRSGRFDESPIGPFASEGESFVAVFEELAACAEAVFRDQTRPGRDPANWTSDELAEGLGDPGLFIAENRIGFPMHNVSPRRKLSWWFNPALETFAILRTAGVSVPVLRPGFLQPN